MTALQLLLNVATLASAYALVAIGFVLILNATGAVNFAHGDLVMVGGFAAVSLASWLHVPGIVLLPLLLAGMAVLGVAVALAAYFPLRRRPPESVFLSTIALGIVLQNAANLIYGAEPRAAPPLLSGGQVRIGASTISEQGLAIIVVAAVLILLLYLVFTGTQTGRRLRATAQDPDVASAIGIRVDLMVAATFAVATALAGAAGLLLANAFFVTPTDGSNYILKAYIAATIGGWGSIPGAVLGAVLIAAFEVVYPSLPLLAPGLLGGADAWFSQTVSTIAMDVVILAILVLRPQGLFGEAVRQRP
jgi:branched-chain amino acid transport system permease protein